MRPKHNFHESDYIQDCSFVDREFDQFEMDDVMQANIQESQITTFLNDTFDLKG